MLSLAKQKFIRSLEQKKYRTEFGVFLAEGSKCCSDLLGYLPCRLLIATDEWLVKNPEIRAKEIFETNRDEIKKISLQKSPQEVIAVFEMPRYSLNPDSLKGKLTLALDKIQDPGNLGTILRLADWFGIEDVICSVGTVDAFNPKTVQATMGAIGKVRIHYTRLEEFLAQIDLPVFGTFLEGTVLYETELSQEGIIVMGNEGNGISPAVEKCVTRKLYIPDYPMGKTGSESLNVGVATAIVCSEFRRRYRK